MLENIIFHFIFIFFTMWAFVWWLTIKRKFEHLRFALLPMLLKKKIELPKDRSSVVRSRNYLQEELSQFFHCKVAIKINFSKVHVYDNFLIPLYRFIEKNRNDSEKYFLCESNLYSVNEILFYINMKNNRKYILFNLNENLWTVEIINAK